MGGIVKATASSLIALIFVCLLLVNLLGGVVSGIWLLAKGEWRLVGFGIAMGFAMPWAWAIASMPAMAIGGVLFVDPTKRSRHSLLLGALVVTLWNAALVCAWCFLVFTLFAGRIGAGSSVPFLLWIYATTMSPLAYMAKQEPANATATSLGLLLALVTFLFLLLSYLIGLSFHVTVIGVGSLAVAEALLATAAGYTTAMDVKRASLGEDRSGELLEVAIALEVLTELQATYDCKAFEIVQEQVRELVLQDPGEFVAMIQRKGLLVRQWVVGAVANIAGDHAESGEYHVYRGALNPLGPGEDFVDIHDSMVDELTDMGVHSREKAERIKAALREQIARSDDEGHPGPPPAH